MKCMYDIFLDKLEQGNCVGTNGDEVFDTEDEHMQKTSLHNRSQKGIS